MISTSDDSHKYHENLSEDFQAKQIERIVEAISLSLPNE
jgi:hypothetical protein